jgi:hypothetical protein
MAKEHRNCQQSDTPEQDVLGGVLLASVLEYAKLHPEIFPPSFVESMTPWEWKAMSPEVQDFHRHCAADIVAAHHRIRLEATWLDEDSLHVWEMFALLLSQAGWLTRTVRGTDSTRKWLGQMCKQLADTCSELQAEATKSGLTLPAPGTSHPDACGDPPGKQ